MRRRELIASLGGAAAWPVAAMPVIGFVHSASADASANFATAFKTVKALGFTVPPGVLAIADEVIE